MTTTFGQSQPRWSVADVEAARLEGWELSEVKIGPAVDLVVSAVGGRFSSDREAFDHVLKGASDVAVLGLRVMMDGRSTQFLRSREAGQIAGEVMASMMWGPGERELAAKQGWALEVTSDSEFGFLGGSIKLAKGSPFHSDFDAWDHVLKSGSELARHALSALHDMEVELGGRRGDWRKLVARYKEMVAEEAGMLVGELQEHLTQEQLEANLLDARTPDQLGGALRRRVAAQRASADEAGHSPVERMQG